MAGRKMRGRDDLAALTRCSGMRSLHLFGVLGALALLLGPTSAHGQSRVERIEVESPRFGQASYCRSGARWQTCSSHRAPHRDILELSIEHGLGTRAGGARTPPRRARFIGRWLRHRWQSAPETWGVEQPTRWGGHRRVEVSSDRRHVHITESSCGDAGCDCSSEVVIDATWDESGRLQRVARMTTTCECVDSILMEDVLRWDASGTLVGVRRGHYEHPFCRMEDEAAAERFSSDTLRFPDGTMPPPDDVLECVVPDAEHFVCVSTLQEEQSFSVRYLR